ncbi:TetR/AcrR family transcriptional regulator [Paenarthrobacter sp. NPDC092416]|uniref:TetR/AcrR family transcriptional regulator n=1 Tax=Paenarthrobacter sp. NPDC092416 TaxID=3364386 RepID=UPI003829CDF0
MDVVGAGRKIPQQERSRQSEAKLLDAAEEALSARGAGDFSLAEVAARAGVTTGTIYSRFKGKSELVHAVHERVMDRMDAHAAKLFGAAEAEPASQPERFVGDVVSRLAAVLEAEAAVLRALMFHAVGDRSISERGAAAHSKLGAFFDDALQRLSPALPGASERKRYWAFTFSYDVLARHLGLGHSSPRTEQEDWDEMLHNLSGMVAAYLLADHN